MPLTSKEYTVVEDLADLLYDFLPASGNTSTSFPIAARMAGVGELWSLEYSKRPAIVGLLTRTLLTKRDRLPSLMLCVARQSMTWRKRKGNPLTRAEADRLNDLLLALGFRVKDLASDAFLKGLAGIPEPIQTPNEAPVIKEVPWADHADRLSSQLLALNAVAPHERGYAFERFLTDLFSVAGLAPRSAFRLVGEQIDGSFQFESQTYLVEAKWHAVRTGQQDLLAFGGKVDGKAIWTRGLFVSYSGFSSDGLAAFSRGRRTNIICLEGLDLIEMLRGQTKLSDLLAAKARRASETNQAFVPYRDLF
ncbi:MAG: restriction endonuclease [Brevundimonas sp.]|uniref:restriction endonuclease n=1 Tax=Brevundimonas sp. TaxID=1871086 RepID=UPI00391CBEAC